MPGSVGPSRVQERDPEPRRPRSHLLLTVDAEPEAAAAGARPPSREWFLPFLLLLGSAMLTVTALQATRPMVTYRAIDLGAGTFEIGLIQACFSVLPVFTAVALGRLVDRIGEARFLVIGMALFTAGNVILFFGTTLLSLGAGLLVMGLGQIINLVAGQTMIANRGPRERREHRYGWYSTAVSIGQLAGPAIAAALVTGTAAMIDAGSGPSVRGEPNLQAPVFAFASILGTGSFLLVLFLPHRRPRPRQGPVEGEVPGIRAAAVRVLRRPGMSAAMLVSITVVSALDVLIAYLPAYGEANGLSVVTVGTLLTVRAASSLVSRVFMAWLIERLGRENLLAASMVMAGGAMALLPFLTAEAALYLLMVLLGLGLGLGQPMTIAWVANRTPRSERALALGVRVTGNRAALLVVPATMGAIAGASGLAAIWLILAAVLGFGALVARRTPFDELAAERAGGGAASP